MSGGDTQGAAEGSPGDHGAGRAEDHDGRDCGRAGTVADADDVRAGQRVAEHGLEERAGEPERDADHGADHRAGKFVLHHDEAGAGDFFAAGQVGDDDLEEVGDGHGVAAQQHVHGEHDHNGERKDGGPVRKVRLSTRRTWQIMPCFRGFEGIICTFALCPGCVFAQFAAREARSTCSQPGPLSAADQPDEDGRAHEGGHDARRDLAGRRTTRPMMSAESSRTGARTRENGRIQR